MKDLAVSFSETESNSFQNSVPTAAPFQAKKPFRGDPFRLADHLETPMLETAFDLSDDEKILKIEGYFREIMQTLGLDLRDDSLQNTPRRVAKMFVKEIFAGLNPANRPDLTLFDNKFGYSKMVVEHSIPVFSNCEHHFLPIIGKAHVAYISSEKVIGLSKLNRIVEHYARRPQVQERLTIQIAAELRRALKTDDVAVYLEAEHLCVMSRGVKHQGGSTVTFEMSGKFLNEQTKADFLRAIGK